MANCEYCGCKFSQLIFLVKQTFLEKKKIGIVRWKKENMRICWLEEGGGGEENRKTK